jgi:hypothetical protein
MKKIFILLFLCLSLAFLASSCDKHEHEFGEWMTAKRSTCQKEGVEERYCYCLEKETRPAPLDEHTPKDRTNCASAQYCAVCNTKLENAVPHKYGDWTTVKEVTCTSDGWQERSCTACGVSEKKTLFHQGHQYGEWTVVKEATCAENGLREKSCVCGAKISEATTAEHTGEWTVTKEPSKIENGSREKNCTVCHQKITEILYAFGSEGLDYRVNIGGKTCTVTGIGTCTDADVVIPAFIEGYTVTDIEDKAFENCLTMTSLSIPSTVESIGRLVVSGAKNLKSIYYYTDLICKNNTFRDAPIEKVIFGGANAIFISSFVKEVVMTDAVTSVASEAFYSCRYLESISIGKNVSYIGARAFSQCTALSRVEISESVTYIEENAFYGCTALEEITIPASVTTLGEAAFMDCTSLNTVHMFEGLKNIGNNAFSGCTALSSIVIPESVTEIGGAAFYNCTSLVRIAIPESVSVLNDSTFRRCTSLSEIMLSANISYIGGYVFYECKALKNITFLNTANEWNAITKATDWKDESSLSTVTCTNGIISIQ